MLWSDYTALVLEHLSVDATRRGIEVMRARAIRDSVRDLQRYIRPYRQGHTTTYQFADMTAVGQAQLCSFVDKALPKKIYTFSTLSTDDPNINRNEMTYWPWNMRHYMVNGGVGRQAYVYSISPYGDQVMIYPPLVAATTALLVVWDGYKSDFADTDTVPFPDASAEASAHYTKARILRIVDKNINLAREEERDYKEKRLALFRDANDARLADEEDQEYVNGVPVPSGLQSGFNPGVTSWATLANVPTVGAKPLILLLWINVAGDGILKATELRPGTDASDPANGVQRPNDYSSTNQFVWYQVSA